MKTKKIFLASSSELLDDRKEFEILINRKNKDWVAQGVFLELVVWEDFLDAVSKTRLQDEYNKAILDCDIFVMLFCTKVGKYTEEEFETAFGQFRTTNKPFIFTYFKDAAISTGSANKSDLISLWAFQEKLAALGHFKTDYKNIDALKLHFTQQLDKLAKNKFIELGSGKTAAADSGSAVVGGNNADTIITGTQIVTNYLASGNAALSKEQIARHIAGYLRWLCERTENIELRGIERAGGAPVVLLPLASAYVPLRAKAMRLDGKSRRAQRAELDQEAIEHEVDVAMNEVLSLGNRLVITGGPGSGKTTVLLHMAWALASSLGSGAADPARSRVGVSIEPSALPLPIFVPFASFARYRRHLPPSAPAREKTLAYFISHHLISKQADFDLPADFFVQLLKDGRDVILLLDGLDEVANENERAEVRQSVEDLVAGREAMRVVVTCRTIAYRGGRTALGAHFKELAVQALDLEQHIVPMVQQAYQCIYPNDGAKRANRSDDLLRSIQTLEENRRSRLGDDSAALVDSPLMVRLLLIVHVNNRELPDERADLFDKAINALLQVDYGRDESDIRELSTDWKLFRDMAQHVAFHLHQQGSDQGREIGESGLKRMLSTEPDFKPRIEDFLSHSRQRGSVVEEHGGAFRFIHLAFQEFLVARYLSEVMWRESRETIFAFLDERLDDPWWREPILLLAGYTAVNNAKPAREFLAALSTAGNHTFTQISAAELAGTAALEWRESGAAIQADCAKRIVILLNDANVQQKSNAVVRARAGDALAALGDPRFDAQRFYLPADSMLGFVKIAADAAFKIGTRSADAKRVEKIIGYAVSGDEINDQVSPTSEFYIARYLVTVAQFRVFVEATQFQLGDDNALYDPDNRPVRNVNWHEALAYCAWLNKALTTAPVLAGSDISRLARERGWRVALPSELEWEKATRGSKRDAIFSWGDKPDPNSANYNDTDIGTTSTVGCFMANELNLSDMIGNVWEWIQSQYAAYPYHADDGRENLESDERRVVRGGSWHYFHDHARCASRDGDHPGARDDNIGFRVVLRPSPVV